MGAMCGVARLTMCGQCSWAGCGGDNDECNLYAGEVGTQLRYQAANVSWSQGLSSDAGGELASGGLCGPVNSSLRCSASGTNERKLVEAQTTATGKMELTHNLEC
jgi:hypothetical protein